MLKRFHTEQALNQLARFNVLAGKYLGMFITVSGTNQAGQTLAASDLGIIQILKNGVQKYNVDFDALQQSHNALDMGAIEAASAAGGAFRFTVFVPFVDYFNGQPDDVALLIEDNEWEVIHNYPNVTTTLVASGSVKFYGFKADNVAVSPYERQIINHHINVAGAGHSIHKVYAENVTHLYIEKDANISNITVMKDGVPFLDNVEIADINSADNLLTVTETYDDSLPFLKVDLNPTNEMAGSYAKDIEIQLTATGACVVRMLAFSQYMTPDRLTKSVVMRNVSIDQKIMAKPNIAQRLIDSVKSQKLES